MSRDFYVNGEALIQVKGRTDSSIASLSQLGLAADQCRITPVFKHRDINLDAWGEAAADVQFMLAEVRISMTLIWFDRTVLNTCIALAMGGSQANVGQMNRAGIRLGNNLPRFGVGTDAQGNVIGNNYVGLNIAAPVGGIPFRFFYAFLADPPITFPLGTEKHLMPLNWRAIAYTQDPSGQVGGKILGAQGYLLWDNNQDT